jgi:predicted trehalose synthase
MSEYFEAWKNSRFIAGERASENAFVAASRLEDIADILSGLVTVYGNVRPLVAEADAEQAGQIGTSLRRLHSYAAGLRDREAAGREYTAEEADLLGARAQEQAEAIAGQVTQAAAKLNIEIQEG